MRTWEFLPNAPMDDRARRFRDNQNSPAHAPARARAGRRGASSRARGRADRCVVTLQLKAGDCDDHSVLIAALLKSIGYQVQFKTVATERGNPQQFSHVYVIVRDKRTGQWVPLDSTVPGSFAGWEPPMIYRSRTYRFPGMGDWVSKADEVQYQPVYQPLVPAPPAPAGLGPKAQFAYNLTAPLAQALASQVAHGTTPAASATANLNLGLGGASGLPTWVWLLGIGGLIWAFTRNGR